MKPINFNADFLFIYEAINCNPNGDPDQENKPRMDYETNTNLVTDTRLKRYIRDYLQQNGHSIFVAMDDQNKVSPDSRLSSFVEKALSDTTHVEEFFRDAPEMKSAFDQALSEKAKDKSTILARLQDKGNRQLNAFILDKLVKDEFIDIRLFGSAFAVDKFTNAYTGPVQINWGYSLNEVFPIESDSIVTIMNDDNSTFGKDYRVHYSLLAFHGTINKQAAKITGLTEQDLDEFRLAIWNAIPALPTRSKQNQYPRLYLELQYNDEYHNGYFGDLRNLITCTAADKAGDFRKVRKYQDLTLDFSRLTDVIRKNKGTVLKNVVARTAQDMEFNV